MAECVEWSGYRNRDGYGKVAFRGKAVSAHRVAWIRAHGEIPEGMVVMHTCDNPPCVSVDHLRLGTQQENIADMDAKGRRRSKDQWGAKNSSAKLRESQVLSIRELCAWRILPQSAIAKLFRITQTAVSAIHRRATWRHLP